MKKDHEFIKEMFESDGIKAPESLSEENILKMLEASDTDSDKDFTLIAPEKKHGKRKAAKKILAACAALLVAAFGISGLNALVNRPPDTSLSSGELYTFRNEREIANTLKSLNKSSFRLFSGLEHSAPVEEDVLEYSTDAGASEAADGMVTNGEARTLGAQGTAKSESHSSTYLQEEEVDEADIVKTDGKYIYYVTTTQEVVILSAKDGKTERLSKIGNNGVENYIEDIYLKGDTLVTIGRYYTDDSDDSYSGIVIYDISDRSKPEMVSDFSQTGNIVSSRMVGNYVYLVTSDYVYSRSRTLPMCGSSGQLSKLPAGSISCVPEPKTCSYIVLSAVDIESGSQGRTATKAILGASSDVYCTDHSLYSASYEWDSDNSCEYTRIVRAQLNGTDVRFDATTKVRGSVLNQFAMDEQDGYFRIATTSERGGIDVNNLFVLDSELKESGKVTGFARNESIKAVRYIGSKAYVITYEAIDPLFIIDLSDPADPRIEGEVMIDGFSTLLIPLGGEKLLGIGHATGDNGYGGEYDSGLKLALFDISDPSEPKVIDSREFKDMTSFAQSDHHALTINSEKGYFAIPYEIYNYDVEILEEETGEITEDISEDVAGEESSDAAAKEPAAEPDIYYDEPYEVSYETGVLVFKAGDKIHSVSKHKLDSGLIYRSVFIGDWIYALDEDGNVQSFKPEA